jgi:hypothetical protein
VAEADDLPAEMPDSMEEVKAAPSKVDDADVDVVVVVVMLVPSELGVEEAAATVSVVVERACVSGVP